MSDFGVTKEGFIIKGLDVILSEALGRATDMFGPTVDLTATSPLLKIIQVAATEGAEIWKSLEDVYYSNFISTGLGDNLDLLGEDLGLVRQNLFAEGEVTFTLGNPAPNRTYTLADGAMVITAAPVRTFYTTAAVSLSAAAPKATVLVRAYERGLAGNLNAGEIIDLDSDYRNIYLNNLGGATLTVTNAQPFGQGNATLTGIPLASGADTESDEVFRNRLLGWPRHIWTLESVRRAVLEVDGVIDVLPFDPLGGVDISQSYFNLFDFSEGLFSGERRLGEPYFFNIIVAHEFAWPWEATGGVTGIASRVRAAVEQVRPVGIHPNIIQADHIEVGLQAKVLVAAGYDSQALLAAVKQRIAQDVNALKLGGDVLYSQIMCAFIDQPGVMDVQNLRLRRCPAAFGRITFGGVPFQTDIIEAGPGENLAMNPTEIAVFQLDSDLIDLEVVVS
jgi:uncharacterized phage protein gp47/JayE